MSVGFNSSGYYGDFDNYFITERELVDRYVSGKIWSWYMFPGDGTTTSQVVPNGLNYLNQTKNIKQVWAMFDIGFAITETGELWSWGSNNSRGALGQNTITAQYSPAQVYGGGNTWSYVQAHYTGGSSTYSVCALKTDGTAWVWGDNQYGQFGTLNVNVHYSTPVQFMAGRTFKSISTGGQSIAAVTSNGELWTAGYNNNGQLGEGYGSSLNSRSSPVQIGPETNWKMVDKGFDGGRAIKTDGTLWSWGYGYGANGDGTTAFRSSPVQEYHGATDWVSVSGTQYGVFGIKSDGSLWAWSNTIGVQVGILGNDTRVGSAIPLRVPGTQNWKSVTVGQSSFPHAVGLTKDGQIWTWGWNSTSPGALADTTTSPAHRSRPVQVLPGRFWRKASANIAIY